MPRGGDQEQNRITSPPCLVERILPDGPARSRQRDRAASRHPYDRSSARTKTVMSMTKNEDDDLARWLRLTEKQRACLDLLIERKTSKEIARILGISKPTVDQRITAARIILGAANRDEAALIRSDEHTSELQSLMRTSYASICLKKQKTSNHHKMYQ